MNQACIIRRQIYHPYFGYNSCGLYISKIPTKEDKINKMCKKPSYYSLQHLAMSCSAKIFEAILAIPNLYGLEKNPTKLVVKYPIPGKKTEDVDEVKLASKRRLAIGLAASIAIFGNACVGSSRADDNGYWLTTPLVVPKAKNKIVNSETGTRSFVKKQIYIANIGTKNRMNRIKRYAFDLLALGDLIGQDAWNYVRKYLCIKATFMYFDFDELISAAATEDKEPILNLANKLFDSFEKLDSAVKKKDLQQTESCYKDTTDILQEVMIRMA